MESPSEQPVEIWGGLECTINRVGNAYFDQLSYSGHRERAGDMELFASLGLKKMRYPILWEHHQPENNISIDWDATAAKLDDLRANDIAIIAGLVHHGSGPAFVQIIADSFAVGLAAYAGQVAEKFPGINYYTPVNEPLTTARFCGLYGLWYPHKKDDAGFCRILINECKATVLAMAAIRIVNPSAKLLQTEDLGKAHSSAALQYQADFENQRRWLSFDLLCGRVNSDHVLWNYLTSHGIAAGELEYFVANPCPPDVVGVNYYLTSERYLDECKADYPAHTHGGNGHHTYADVEAVRVSAVRPDGLQSLLNEAWNRYQIPVAVTEVHLHCTREEQMRWLNEAWMAANNLKRMGVPIVAITPWALLGAYGWDQLLTRPGGTYEPGTFDTSGGSARSTILAEMIRAYSNNQSFEHPALMSPGWWQRPCRVAYGKEYFFQPPSGRTLAISGTRAADLAEVCRARCLNYIQTNEITSDGLMPEAQIWANITVNEYMEVRCLGRPDLVINLNAAHLYGALNAGLDLFIDGETGAWEISHNGRTRKCMPDYLTHLL
ncbi:MAG: sugar nucleotide-binding protein [Mucilaginibacter sp.]|nr:sugar nucleotide-binding protein [Mucilaginibacter sp.]